MWRTHAASRVGTLKPALLAALLRAPAVVAQRLVGLRLALPACDVKELVLRDTAVLLRVGITYPNPYPLCCATPPSCCGCDTHYGASSLPPHTGCAAGPATLPQCNSSP